MHALLVIFIIFDAILIFKREVFASILFNILSKKKKDLEKEMPEYKNYFPQITSQSEVSYYLKCLRNWVHFIIVALIAIEILVKLNLEGRP